MRAFFSFVHEKSARNSLVSDTQCGIAFGSRRSLAAQLRRQIPCRQCHQIVSIEQRRRKLIACLAAQDHSTVQLTYPITHHSPSVPLPWCGIYTATQRVVPALRDMLVLQSRRHFFRKNFATRTETGTRRSSLLRPKRRKELLLEVRMAAESYIRRCHRS
jgi:hypothetical protein